MRTVVPGSFRPGVLARQVARASALALALVSGAACQWTEASRRPALPSVTVGTAPAANLTDACVGDYDEDVDYFPDKATVRIARTFSITYHRSYKVIHFRPAIGTEEQIDYVLLQCGAPDPGAAPPTRTVQVPVTRFVTQWPSYHLLVDRLGLQDRLVGVESLRPITIPSLVARGEQGLLQEVGSGTHASIEKTIAVDPEVIFTFYSAFPNDNTHPKLWDLGIRAVPLADHFEATPLGRSEWMKFLAVFFNRERDVERLFDETAASYDALRALAARTAARPAAMLGFPSDRTYWAENGRQNYVARLIADAGGTYVWHSDSMRTLEMVPFELVFGDNAETYAWLGSPVPGSTLSALFRQDARLQWLGPVARGRVFSNDNGRLPSGGVPAANEGLVRPDAVLADIIRILHPELDVPTSDGGGYYREVPP